MTIAVLVLYGVVGFLLLAIAGLLARLLRLEAKVGELSTQRVGSSDPFAAADERKLRAVFGRQPTVVLVVDAVCVACRDVFNLFSEFRSESVQLAVSFPDPSSRVSMQERLRVVSGHLLVDDSEIFNALDPGVHPSLVELDAKGHIVSVEPVGSADALRKVMSNLQSKETAA
jgi:hypothetical protein